MTTERLLSEEITEGRNYCCCICGKPLMPVEEYLSENAEVAKQESYCLKCWFLAWRGYAQRVHSSRPGFGYSASNRSPVQQTPHLGAETSSVAVLPFVDFTPGSENAYLTGGLTEDLIARLSTVQDLRVIARSSVIEYSGSEKSLREIRNELGVSSLIKGGVIREGNRLRISVRLVDTEEETDTWAEDYDENISSYFEILNDITRQVASALATEVTPEEDRRLGQVPTENVEAYELFLKGRDHLDRQDQADNEKAIQVFNRALELDPHFALAYVGLGEAYIQRVQRYGAAVAWLDSSVEMAEKALSLDPHLAEAYSTLSLVYYLRGWVTKALKEDRKAIGLNPNSSSVIYSLGYDYWSLGDLAETLRWLKKAVSLDPRDPENFRHIGWIYWTFGKGDEAERWLRKSLELQPNYAESRYHLGYLYLDQGKYDQAERQSQRILSMHSDSLHGLDLAAAVKLKRGELEAAKEYCRRIVEISSSKVTRLTKVAAYRFGYILWIQDRKADARRLFDEQVKQHQQAVQDGDQGWDSRFFLACIHAVQGIGDTACSWLRKAIEAGFRDCRYFAIWDDWAALQDNKEFGQVISQFLTEVDKMRRRAEAIEEQEVSPYRLSESERGLDPAPVPDEAGTEGKD